MSEAAPTLAELGWDEERAEQLDEWGDEAVVPARVVAEYRGELRIITQAGEGTAKPSGRLRHRTTSRADLPAVGDWVALEPVADGPARIHGVLPRTSKFSRKAPGEHVEEQVLVANVDVVWIVSALDSDLSPRRIERYVTLTRESGARPEIVLTKSDLVPGVGVPPEVEEVAPGVPVHVISSVTGEGVEALRDSLEPARTVVLLGSSGVGKSTLINRLAGRELMRVQEVREFDGKGRHTTTHRQLHVLPGGALLIDTPGMRELQLWVGEKSLDEAFPEVEELAAACRFNDCTHSHEPGCAVLAAVEEGDLPRDRLESFRKLRRELDHLERKVDEHARREEKGRAGRIHGEFRRRPKR